MYHFELRNNHIFINHCKTASFLRPMPGFNTVELDINDSFSLLKEIKSSNLPVQLQPVAIIGPKEATLKQTDTAYELGYRLGEYGIPVICGGGEGVMEAAAHGIFKSGGCSIGILPGEKYTEANAYITYAIATGMGKARNSIIAHAAACLIGIGGGYGTITEMAYGKHFNKEVIALEEKPCMEGVIYAKSIECALQYIADILLFGCTQSPLDN